MNLYHDSHDLSFREPFGAAVSGSRVRLAIRADGAREVFLRVWSAASGEQLIKMEPDYEVSNATLLHFINQALRANYAMKNDVDYVVQDGEVVIVDQFTGRLMKGRAYSDGLHQAIEAKEGVQINEETKTLATITFQNLFRMYKKLSGMTGTAKTEEEEFRNIYNM